MALATVGGWDAPGVKWVRSPFYNLRLHREEDGTKWAAPGGGWDDQWLLKGGPPFFSLRGGCAGGKVVRNLVRFPNPCMVIFL